MISKEEAFFIGVLLLLLLRILFRESAHVEGLSCSNLYMYDYIGTGERDEDETYGTDCVRDYNGDLICTSAYDTTKTDAAAEEEYVEPVDTCVEGDDGDWKWTECSTKCGEGVQNYIFERKVGSMCVPPTDCKLGDGNCITKCTDYSSHNCTVAS